MLDRIRYVVIIYLKNFKMESIAINGKVMAAADFVAGFMYGMTEDNKLVEVEACYQGGEMMYDEIETGIADIKLTGWDNDVQAALNFALVAL